jgi:hypothetical protein
MEADDEILPSYWYALEINAESGRLFRAHEKAQHPGNRMISRPQRHLVVEHGIDNPIDLLKIPKGKG